jgi:hypothetical protein
MVSLRQHPGEQEDEMPKRLRIELSEEQAKQLIRWTKNPPRPHLRRKAWAILLVARGDPVYQVAENSRVRAHRETVSEWVGRFMAQGVEGLNNRPGQGRKPVFPPRTKGDGQEPTGRGAA